jgi:hypothetical protein
MISPQSARLSDTQSKIACEAVHPLSEPTTLCPLSVYAGCRVILAYHVEKASKWLKRDTDCQIGSSRVLI